MSGGTCGGPKKSSVVIIWGTGWLVELLIEVGEFVWMMSGTKKHPKRKRTDRKRG